MDFAALVRAGRQAEIFAALEPQSDAGSHAASGNLAIVHRWLGDKAQQQFYALRAYQQDPSSVDGVSTLFTALMAGDQPRLLTDIYAAFPNKGRLGRDQHLYATLAYCRINRIAEAQAALDRICDFPRDQPGDLRVAMRHAAAAGEHAEVLRLLDRLGALGQDVEGQRVVELFAASDFPATVRCFETHADSHPSVAAKAALAMFSAIILGDREKVSRLMPATAGDAFALARLYLDKAEDVEVRGDVRRYRFPFEPTNLTVAMSQAQGQFYEARTLRRLKGLLTPGDQVIDVGANIGNHTIYFAGEAGCRVLPLECNSRLVPRLMAAVETAELTDLVDLAHLGKAVSDALGEITFNLLRDDFSNISRAPIEGATKVPSITLDSLAVDSCKLLKIDVDGGEVLVLRGAEGLLSTHRPIVAIEVSNFNTVEILAFMERQGYGVVREDFSPATYSDFLFAPLESEFPSR